MSNKQIEAMKLALEALDELYLPGELERVNKAITALREALMSGTDGAEQPAQQEPAQWQPIETAPKDGRMILVCLPRQMDLVVRAWYRDYKGFWLTDENTDGGITRPAFFHEGDLWHPIPPINKSMKENT
jgi:hypothetical protein